MQSLRLGSADGTDRSQEGGARLDLRADRREFTLAAMLAMLGGVSMTISGCGKASSPAGPSTPPVSDKNGNISGNHGHVAVITSGQLTAANTLALSLKGTASHDHMLELTGADLVQIRDGQRLEKEIGTSHKHIVTFN